MWKIFYNKGNIGIWDNNKKRNGTAMIYNNNENWNKDKFEGEGFN